MVSAYWTRDDLLPFAREIRQISAIFCEIGEGWRTPEGVRGESWS